MIHTSTKVREFFTKVTGYWIFKQKKIPVGCDLFNDLKFKISMPVNTVFDVGANIGQTAIKFYDYFDEAKIYSFEPVTSTFEILNDNTRLLDRISTFNVALGEQVEQLEINLFESNASVLNSLKKEAMNSDSSTKQVVQVTTGDIFCKQNNINQIDLLKIDTEGYEINVLKGFSNMMGQSKIKAIYCEVGLNVENNRSTYLVDLINFANAVGFKLYGIYEIDNSEIKAGFNYGNLLFIKA